eukprot:TRINITY_DN930_c0_g1_i4.p1 TRINITY_DN930_c0_g1~~TRINITY_DN930_c0_g1_i4.p1  ORF type:complete len:227 (-),score=74.73 TRINITY_DN930_c0_g1_i4:381-1025(-)
MAATAAASATGSDYDFLFKVVLIGDSGVGKTRLLLNYFGEDTGSDSTVSTIGLDIKFKTIKLDGKVIKLHVWDTAGQERYKAVTPNVFRSAHGILVVYDVTSKPSFSNVKTWMEMIERHANENITVVLVGNKSDLGERQVSFIEGERLSQQFSTPFMETSAKSGDHVSAVFDLVCKEIMLRSSFSPAPGKGPSVNPSSSSSSSSSPDEAGGCGC